MVNRSVSDEEIEAAARAAGHPRGKSNLPSKDTNPGWRNKGVTLSGGQKQRVAIARTLLKKSRHPDHGRLDFHSVDLETEGEIRDA